MVSAKEDAPPIAVPPFSSTWTPISPLLPSVRLMFTDAIAFPFSSTAKSGLLNSRVPAGDKAVVLSAIATVAVCGGATVAPLNGKPNAKLNVSSPSTNSSLAMGIVTVWTISPGAKLIGSGLNL